MSPPELRAQNSPAETCIGSQCTAVCISRRGAKFWSGNTQEQVRPGRGQNPLTTCLFRPNSRGQTQQAWDLIALVMGVARVPARGWSSRQMAAREEVQGPLVTVVTYAV